MTMAVEENLAADEYYAADEPSEDDVSAGQDTGPEAPYGYMEDPITGERRPKKRAGRPKRPPTAEELAAAPPLERGQDKPPRPSRKRSKPAGQAPEPEMPAGGVIAAGVNRLYRRAGRIIRAMDRDIGQAIIECTRPDPEEPDELTVGQAWENLCKTNPRIRRFILGALAGGAWSDLLMAHAPIGIAFAMKPWVQRLIPFGRFVESVGEPDEDSAQGEGNLPGGMTADDVGEMSKVAQDMARRAAQRAGFQVSEEEMAEAVRQAEAMGNIPAGLRRQQPKRPSRAARTGKR